MLSNSAVVKQAKEHRIVYVEQFCGGQASKGRQNCICWAALRWSSKQRKTELYMLNISTLVKEGKEVIRSSARRSSGHLGHPHEGHQVILVIRTKVERSSGHHFCWPLFVLTVRLYQTPLSVCPCPSPFGTPKRPIPVVNDPKRWPNVNISTLNLEVHDWCPKSVFAVIFWDP